MPLLFAWLIAAPVLSCLMALAWYVQRRSGNAGWIDAIWSGATGAVGLALSLAPLDGVYELSPRQSLVALCCFCWSARLAGHIAGRSRHQHDDPRYAQLRLDWGADFSRRLFWFLQIQAGASWLLVLAVMLAAHNPAPGLLPWDAAAVLLALLGISGETLADRQLRRFRAASTGSVCDTGFWGWSRHPNYFCEWLTWCSYPLFALSGGGNWPAGWAAFVAPLLMYWLLVHASGIPPLEAYLLRSRGAAYTRYQARVSAFFPLAGARNRD